MPLKAGPGPRTRPAMGGPTGAPGLSAEALSERFSAVEQEVNEAVKQAEDKATPSVSSMFEDVYRDPTPQLLEQRDDLLSLGEASAGSEGFFPL